jgi:two-component system phosphate regulon sensor histidine kinase PhoR
MTEQDTENQVHMRSAEQLTALRRLLETTRECVLVVGRDMRISAANAAARSTFTRGPGELDGRRLSEVIRDLELHEAFSRALFQGTASDVRLEFAPGGKLKFDVHVAPIDLDHTGGAIGFFYDITKIERLETVRQEFLSNISHELRTPLTSIIAFVETLEDGGIDDEENRSRFLAVIRRNAERMKDLIADILELSLIESGAVSVEFRDVKLSTLVREVFASLSANAAERNITLTSDVPATTLVAADSIRLEQMLTNLVDNAIKFNRNGGAVTVTYERKDQKDVISVTDTGEGIMPEHLQRIFERFYRTDRARSREIGGTGLGLAIVKHLAKLHGGEVVVRSALSSGTTFSIHLPIR